MKKTFYIILSAWACVSFLSSCNDEWKDEQFAHYVSLKAPTNASGYTVVHVKLKSSGESVSYKLPVIVSGSRTNQENLRVHIGVDPDTLARFNLINIGVKRTDIYYKLLPEENYSFNEVVDIPAGENVALLDIGFRLNTLDLVDKWILPLTVLDDPSYGYESNKRKHYRKALLKIEPFNDYSGDYSAGSCQSYFADEAGNADFGAQPLITQVKRAYAVNDEEIFFYAGSIDESFAERAKYKINVKFGKNGALTLSASDPGINFRTIGDQTYETEATPDATRPYLIRKYVILTVNYFFTDKTGVVPMHYVVKGSMTLQRTLNTQIPDEDQQIEW